MLKYKLHEYQTPMTYDVTLHIDDVIIEIYKQVILIINNLLFKQQLGNINTN